MLFRTPSKKNARSFPHTAKYFIRMPPLLAVDRGYKAIDDLRRMQRPLELQQGPERTKKESMWPPSPTDDEERAVGLADVVPFLLASRLRERGAIHVQAANWHAHVDRGAACDWGKTGFRRSSGAGDGATA